MALVPSLVAFASSHGIPLDGIAVAAESAVPQKGDQVVVLLALEKGGTTQQWLVRVGADDLTEKEQKMKPWPDDVIHTSTGLHLQYANTPTALLVELTGPFSAGSTRPPGATAYARSLVSREYLDLGIAQYCRSALQIVPRMQAAGIEQSYYAGGTSIPSAEAVVYPLRDGLREQALSVAVRGGEGRSELSEVLGRHSDVGGMVAGAAPRRDRNRKGTRRAGHSYTERTTETKIRRCSLCRTLSATPRKRIIRPRKRRVHRCA
jgi:hypothetical protein